MLTILPQQAHPASNASLPPLVSIIIPCYNSAEFIAEAIESALAQTYPRVEILVIDDGSTDGSADIIARYPVRSFHTSRAHVSAARNFGIRESLGQYVLFLDSDDRLLPNAVSAGVNAISMRPDCCMTAGGHNLIAENGDLLRTRTKPLHTRDAYARLLKHNFIECTSSVLFRRSAIIDAGGFDIDLHVSEDYDIYLRMARQCSMCLHSEVITEYRIHGSNISHKSAMMLVTTLKVLHRQHRYAFTSLKRSLCYLYGTWFWRRKYGRQLTRELVTNRQAMQKGNPDPWRILLREYPVGVLIALASRLLPFAAATALLNKVSGVKYTAPTTGSIS